MYAKKEKMFPTYVSKHNSNREKQVILLLNPTGEGHERSETLATLANIDGRWHYLAVKKLSELSRGINSKHYGDFYFVNCLHFFRRKRKINHRKKYVKITIFVM